MQGWPQVWSLVHLCNNRRVPFATIQVLATRLPGACTSSCLEGMHEWLCSTVCNLRDSYTDLRSTGTSGTLHLCRLHLEVVPCLYRNALAPCSINLSGPKSTVHGMEGKPAVYYPLTPRLQQVHLKIAGTIQLPRSCITWHTDSLQVSSRS